MPAAITLTSEYCPERNRSFLVMVMFCGFTMGGALGGLSAATLIADFGWQGVLILGGVLPLALAAALAFLLPESVRYLVLKGGHDERVGAVPRRVDPVAVPDRGGLSAATLIADFGWQGVLILGGVLPLALAAALVFLLPESVRYLVLKGGHDERVGAVLRRVDPQASLDGARFVGVRRVEGSPVRRLFLPGLA